MAIQKVTATQDDSGHWYIVPEPLIVDFNADLSDETLVDSGEFDDRYGKYRTGGDINNIQLYADI